MSLNLIDSERLTPERTEGSQGKKSYYPYLDHIKKLNYIKRENLDIKSELKQLNKSLDKILKAAHARNTSYNLSPLKSSEIDINSKIKNNEILIAKYQNEISEFKLSEEYNQKVSIINQIKAYKKELKELDLSTKSEALTLNSRHFGKIKQKTSAKELDNLKERQKLLEDLIKQDGDIIDQSMVKLRAVNEQSRRKRSEVNEVTSEKDVELQKSINFLKDKVDQLEALKQDEEENQRNSLNEIKTMIEEKKSEIAKLEAILKEKDKMCRLKKMHINNYNATNIALGNKNLGQPYN